MEKNFKYVNSILLKEKYILGRIGLYFGGFGEKQHELPLAANFLFFQLKPQDQKI